MSREAGHKPRASSPPEPSLPPGPPSRQPPRTTPNGPWLHLFGYVLLALAVLWWWQGSVSALTAHELSYREFRQHLEAGTLAELRIGEHEIEGLVQLAPAAPRADAAARNDAGAAPAPPGAPVPFRTVRVEDPELLGGRAAEDLVFGDVSTGAESDLEMATALARRIVGQFGMGKSVGLLHVARESWPGSATPGLQRDCSEQTAHAIDEEVRELLDGAYAAARRVLVDHREQLETLASALLEHATPDAAALPSLLADSA